MAAKVAVLTPTLGRARRIPEMIENVRETAGARARVHFVVEDHDAESIAALGRRKFTVGKFGTYARAINGGYLNCRESIILTCDDDCYFHQGWLEPALELLRTKFVVGTNDLHNPRVLDGQHSTHSFVDRRYIDNLGAVLDQGPGSFMYEYDHNYTDAELVETAKARGVFAPCLDSVVEHVHPDYGGRPADDTWQKTRRAVAQDHAIFTERRNLWEHDPELRYSEPLDSSERT